MKRVLVIYYSQSGQLIDIVQSILSPVRESPQVEITLEELKPVNPYPFPWPFFRFLEVFPESVLMEPPEMEPFAFDAKAEFDLVILAYTVWYLAPAPPMAAFLKSPEAAIMKDVPVITVVNARDKWLMAQEKVKAELNRIGARLIDNAAFIHQGSPFQHLVSTLRWMWTGKKTAFWGMFPPAGVDDREIRGAARFGEAIREALESGEISRGRPVLRGLGAVKVDQDCVIQETLARPDFVFWAKLIRAAGKPGSFQRAPLLLLFGLQLLCLLAAAAPILVLYKLFFEQSLRRKIEQRIKYYEQPSGSSTEKPDNMKKREADHDSI